MTSASVGLTFLWFALPEAYSFINELTLAPTNSLPVNWKTIEEPKWGIRLKVPPDAEEQSQGNLWIHKNDSFKVIVDFGKDGLGSLVSEKVRLKTAVLKKNYSQKVITHNGLKTLVCSYEKAAALGSDPYSQVVELIYLEGGEPIWIEPILIAPTYRVEYKSRDDQQTALQILQSGTFFHP